MSIVKQIQFDNFKSFYNAIGPSGKLIKNFDGFVFRGHSSQSYKLLPSIYRYNIQDGEYDIHKLFTMVKAGNQSLQYMNTEEFQVVLEYLLLQKFYRIANYSFIIKEIQKKDFRWIHPNLVELAALAQHYRIPTRLLDWSFDIYVALYFAVKGACEKIANNKNRQDYFELWAINYNYFQENYSESFPFKFIIPYYHNNTNLCAQKGLLSYVEIKYKHLYGNNEMNKLKRRVVSVDVLLSRWKNYFKNIDILYKISIPYSCAKDTFFFLNKMNYNASRIFPGYWGVVKELNEKKYIYDR